MKMKFKRYWILSSIVFIVLLINSRASLADPWKRLGDMQAQARNHFRATLMKMNGKVYVTGGWPTLTSFQVYDPSTDTWTRKADLLRANGREGHGACAVDGILYVIGGFGSGTLRNTVEAYDPGTDTWTRKAGMINARRNAVMSVIDGRIYVASGQSPEVSLEM